MNDTNKKTSWLSTVREGQATNDNVGVWNAQTGELVRSYVQRKNENWQPQWTSDDGHMALLMGGGVMVFKREDLSNCALCSVWERMWVAYSLTFFLFAFPGMLHAKIEDLAAFKLAPHKSTITFAAFIAGKSVSCTGTVGVLYLTISRLEPYLFHVTPQGRPSSARLYTAPNYSTPICNKSFFNADKVEMTWNKQGTAVLVNTSSDVDKSGQSYYGETHMYYMQTKDGQALPILLGEEWAGML